MSPANPLRQINAFEREARRRWTPMLFHDQRVGRVIDLLDQQCQVMRDLSRDGIILDLPEFWPDLGPAVGAD